MKKVYVVATFGSKPVAVFDERDDALIMANAIYGEEGEERVHEALFVQDAPSSTRFTVIGIGDHEDCDGDGNDR